jgi:hypothetical protein
MPNPYVHARAGGFTVLTVLIALTTVLPLTPLS